MKLTTVFVLIIACLAIVLFLGWTRMPDILSSALSKKMKVSVTIDDIDLSSRSINIQKLEIGNPSGSILRKALSTEEIDINAPLSRYLDRNLVIDEVVMHTVYIGLEFESKNNTNGNWTTIMNNLQGSTAPTEKEKNPRTVLIKKLILTDINIDLVYRKQGGKVQKLPPISHLEFTNVTSEGGIPSDQLTKVILSQMLKSIFQKENLKNMLQDLLDPNAPQGTLEKLVEPFKNLLNFKTAEEEAQDLKAG